MYRGWYSISSQPHFQRNLKYVILYDIHIYMVIKSWNTSVIFPVHWHQTLPLGQGLLALSCKHPWNFGARGIPGDGETCCCFFLISSVCFTFWPGVERSDPENATGRLVKNESVRYPDWRWLKAISIEGTIFFVFVGIFWILPLGKVRNLKDPKDEKKLATCNKGLIRSCSRVWFDESSS